MVCLEGGNFLNLLFLSGLFLLLMSGVQMNSVFFLWMLMEFVFFFVVMLMIKGSKGEVNLSGIIFYLFVQALGGVLLLCSVMVEMLYFGNYYYFGSSICLGCLYLGVAGVVLKMGMFPFYLQVYQIMSFISFDQIALFMLYPKVVPGILLYNMLGQLEMGEGVLVLPMMVIMLSGFQGLKSSDLREFLAWSGLGQLGWIFLSILGSFMTFVYFFFLYSFVLFYVCKTMGKSGKKIFYNFSGVGGSLKGIYNILLGVFFMSGLAPFLMFYLKLFLLFNLSSFFVKGVALILLLSMGMFLFYVRALQMGVSVGNSYYESSPNEVVGLGGYGGFLLFLFFCSGGVLFLI
uniref:NADH-ubiquinone oxidoreductase chain 2 n=1 Tax=Botrylloides nigrum TaxID=1256663 RepID=S0DF34_9ASCI|nr:NADH dehydrogenase subunit 2 [Botrylloides nigrum]CCO25790.1 NADH dehydrogenase subunit 2 [Botrylloides nigrum]